MKKILAQSQKGKIQASVTGDTLRLELDGRIGKWNQASVSDIKAKIKEYAGNATKALIYINSEGGSVFEATEIANVIKSNFKDVKVEIGAIAASAGTYFLTLFHATAKPNSQFMIHKPHGCACGNVDQIKAETKLLENVTKQYADAYVGKMNITADELKEKWLNDWWLTAQEALQLGLIDAISDEPVAITSELADRLVACGVPNANQLTKQQQKPKKEDMDINLLRAKLGLPADASEQQVQAKLNELQAMATKAGELEAKLKAEKEAKKKADIKALMDAAEKAHKINAKMRERYEKLAEADFDQVKAIIEDLPAISEAPSAQLKGGNAEARAKWTYQDYAERDPEAFERLPEEKQKELLDAHYAGGE